MRKCLLVAVLLFVCVFCEAAPPVKLFQFAVPEATFTDKIAKVTLVLEDLSRNPGDLQVEHFELWEHIPTGKRFYIGWWLPVKFRVFPDAAKRQWVLDQLDAQGVRADKLQDISGPINLIENFDMRRVGDVFP